MDLLTIVYYEKHPCLKWVCKMISRNENSSLWLYSGKCNQMYKSKCIISMEKLLLSFIIILNYRHPDHKHPRPPSKCWFNNMSVPETSTNNLYKLEKLSDKLCCYFHLFQFAVSRVWTNSTVAQVFNVFSGKCKFAGAKGFCNIPS